MFKVFLTAALEPSKCNGLARRYLCYNRNTLQVRQDILILSKLDFNWQHCWRDRQNFEKSTSETIGRRKLKFGKNKNMFLMFFYLLHILRARCFSHLTKQKTGPRNFIILKLVG